MLFNSYLFILAFLPLVFAGFVLAQRFLPARMLVAWLVLSSLFYYGWWEPTFVLLLAGSIAVNAAFGKLLCSQQWQIRRSGLLLFFGVSFNFGLLAYFKYAGFLLSNIDDLFGTGFGVPSIVLPIGISFFTFQQIAFLVDARRGLVKEFSWLDYALFVTFFPQLIAGPIVHHAEMMPQFRISRSEQIWHEDVGAGFSIFCFGLFKKVVIADSCAVYADAGYATISSGQALDPASAWITVIAYSLQLYYDFSGYSDMAVGLARIFGIRLPLNFNSPYKATGFIDFWRRWHITLSRFLRDYLYVPLGGSRTGAIRQYVNLAIVMLLGGLWHGANWTFVIWGGLHGFLLGINHAWRAFPCSRHWLFANAASRALSILLTFVLVSLAWIPFRAESLGQASLVLDSLFDFSSGAEGYRESLHYFAKQQFLDMGYAFDIVSWFRPKELWPATPPPNFLSGYRPAGMFLLSVMLVTLFLPNTMQVFARFRPTIDSTDHLLHSRWSQQRLGWFMAVLVSGMLLLSFLRLTEVSPFLYFQF